MSGAVMWLTGLPSSGKTTLAWAVRDALAREGIASVVLDGDEVRAALSLEPRYTPKARAQFYRGLGQLAVLLAQQDLVVMVPATAHRRAWRAFVRARAPHFVEVYVDTPLAECRSRDAKGLYRRGVKVPGVRGDYETPKRPEVTAHGGHSAAAVAACLTALRKVTGRS